MLVVVRFLLDNGTAQRGELINPVIREGGMAAIDALNEEEVSVLVAEGSTFFVFRVPMTRVCSMKEVVPV